MDTATAATLIILVATQGCRVDNIDRAEPTFTLIGTLAECENTASIIDNRLGVRAFCIPETQ